MNRESLSLPICYNTMQNNQFMNLPNSIIHINNPLQFSSSNLFSQFEPILQMPREVKSNSLVYKARNDNPYEKKTIRSITIQRDNASTTASRVYRPKVQSKPITYPGEPVTRTAPVNTTPTVISDHGILTTEMFDKMTEEICMYHSLNAQTEQLYQCKLRLRDELYISMKEVFPFCGLYIVGSSMNGFGSDTSDMDLCLMLSHEVIDQKRDATEILYLLYGALHDCSYIRNINLIRATVPILKFIDTISKVECDLNINNSVGIRNTHLMNAYSRMDVRLAPLIIFVKHWAKVQNINEAKEGTISSFSLVLMVIHFMQCGCNPKVICSLQDDYPEKYNTYRDIRLLALSENQIRYKSLNKQCVGELFVGFLRYYSQEFDFDNYGISVRTGKMIPRHVITHQDIINNNPAQWKELCIEEPFNLSNTARSVHNAYTFQKIKRVFRISYDRITKTANVRSILDSPL